MQYRPASSGYGALLVLLLLPLGLWAQSSAGGQFNRDGLQFVGVTASFGYSSFPVTQANSAAVQPTTTDPSPVVSVSTGFAYYRPTPRGYISFFYSPAYYRRFNNYLSGLSQSLAISSSHQFSPNLAGQFSLTGIDSTAEQFLTTPTVYASAANVPATFDQLAGAMLSGTLTNDQLASILTGAPVVASPARELLYGGRVLGGGARLGFRYTPTGRLSISASAGGSITRRHNSALLGGLLPATPTLLSRSDSVNASLQVRYSLTPRTEVGFGVNSSLVLSNVARIVPLTGTLILSRRLTEHLFTSLEGGVGTILGQASGTAFASSPTTTGSVRTSWSRYNAGGTLGYTNLSSTLLGGWNSSISDPYGLGARYTENTSVAWRWRRPGGLWTTSVSGTYQRLLGSSLANKVSGWQGQASAGRYLSANFRLSASYSYYQNAATIVNAIGGGELTNRLTRFGAQVTLKWVPGEIQSGIGSSYPR